MNAHSQSKRRRLPKLGPIILGTAALIAFGGGTHSLTMGLFALLLGRQTITRPPSWTLGRVPALTLLALLSWILLSLWLPTDPADWRKAAGYIGIPITPSVAPQPWVTLEALLPFCLGIAFLYYASAARPNNPQQRRQGLHLLAGSILALGVGSIIASHIDFRLPWADQVQVFSWFPNRNQTALVYACGSTLFFGLALVFQLRTHRNPNASQPVAIRDLGARIALLGSGGVLLYALFLSLSRGALISWAFGILSLLIFWGATRRQAALRSLRFIPTLGILVFTFFVFFGGESRNRIIDLIDSSTNQEFGDDKPKDFRLVIYSDTISMIANQPLTGVGLGQFRYVFPQYRSLPAAQVSILHPESDWLWWIAELGIIGLFLILIGLGALLFRLKAGQKAHCDGGDDDDGEKSTDHLHRYVAISALVPFFAHSLVDVGAHRLGTALVAIILYTLALPVPHQPSRVAMRSLPIIRICGYGLMILGLAWIGLSLRSSTLLSDHAASATQPLRSRPLEWQPYFRAATVNYPTSPLESLDLFYRARFLRPEATAIPQSEGLFLLRQKNGRGAFSAFESAMRSSPDPTKTFQEISSRTAAHPLLRPRLKSLAGDDHILLGIFWSSVPSELLLAEKEFRQLCKIWNSLPTKSRNVILKKLNGREQAKTALQLYDLSDGDSREQLWSAIMPALIVEGRESEALALFQKFAERISMPREPVGDGALKRLQSFSLLNPQDPVLINRLVKAYVSRQMWPEAKRAAERANDLAGSPSDTLYWLGLAYEKTGKVEQSVHTYTAWLSSN